jgi:hypothetical protein
LLHYARIEGIVQALISGQRDEKYCCYYCGLDFFWLQPSAFGTGLAKLARQDDQK